MQISGPLCQCDFRFDLFFSFSFPVIFRFSFHHFFVLVLVFVNEFVIFSFFTIFVFVNENHTALSGPMWLGTWEGLYLKFKLASHFQGHTQ